MAYFVKTALLLATLMAGCVAGPTVSPTARLVPELQEGLLPYSFAANDRLTGRERARIRGYLASFQLTAEDRLVISVPTDGRPGSSARRGQQLMAALADSPAAVHLVSDPAAAPGQRGIIRVIRSIGLRKDCVLAEAGCATASNLAVMIAAPGDLVLPGLGRRFHPAPPSTPDSQP